MQITQGLLEAPGDESHSLIAVQSSEASVDSLEPSLSTENPSFATEVMEELKTVGIQVCPSKRNVRLQVVPKTSCKCKLILIKMTLEYLD